DGRVNVITYGTFEEHFPTYMPVVENMLNSFVPDLTNAPRVLVGTFDNVELGIHIDLPPKWKGIQKHDSGVTNVFIPADDASLDSDYAFMQIIFGSDADLDIYFEQNADTS